MRVLFVASNPADESTLNLEREITELQRRFSEASGEPVSFVFLPGLNVEDFPSAVTRHKPDILHISAHGANEHLSLSNAAGTAVSLDAEALAAFLPPAHPPRLIYLNACNSDPIAAALAGPVPMAIGSTAPITNRAARAGAVTFYERLLSGTSVRHAFDVGKKMIELLQDKQASALLHCRDGVEPTSEFLHRVPRLLADFANGKALPQRGQYSVRLGMAGCPANTTQVVFFTDDESYIDDEENDLPGDLCIVVRGVPVRGMVWVDRDEAWDVEGDFRLFAVGVTGDQTTFSVASTLCEAIEARYRLGSSELPADVSAAVAKLRQADGAELDYGPQSSTHHDKQTAHSRSKGQPTQSKKPKPSGKETSQKIGKSPDRKPSNG